MLKFRLTAAGKTQLRDGAMRIRVGYEAHTSTECILVHAQFVPEIRVTEHDVLSTSNPHTQRALQSMVIPRGIRRASDDVIDGHVFEITEDHGTLDLDCHLECHAHQCGTVYARGPRVI